MLLNVVRGVSFYLQLAGEQLTPRPLTDIEFET